MDKDRIQSAIDHIKTAVDLDPWAVELAVEAMEHELANNSPKLDSENGDLISRHAFVTELKQMQTSAELWWQNAHEDLIKARAESCLVTLVEIKLRLDKIPSAQPEIKPIEYRDCANAMLKMWMDNVVTDGEYNRIMNKLNAHWGMKNG